MTDYGGMSREELEHAARNWEHQYRLHRAKVEREVGVFAGMPWWVRAGGWFGLPVFLIIINLGQDAGYIPSLSRSTHANVAVMTAAFGEHVKKTDDLLARLTGGLRIMCENSAKDQAERNNCALIR